MNFSRKPLIFRNKISMGNCFFTIFSHFLLTWPFMLQIFSNFWGFLKSGGFNGVCIHHCMEHQPSFNSQKFFPHFGFFSEYLLIILYFPWLPRCMKLLGSFYSKYQIYPAPYFHNFEKLWNRYRREGIWNFFHNHCLKI